MWRVIFILFLVGGTGTAWGASAYGWGLDSMDDKPVSIREQSPQGTHGARIFFFSNPSRRHAGGGYLGGK